jgi:hypothetical protein
MRSPHLSPEQYQMTSLPARLNAAGERQLRPPNAQISSRIGIGTPSNQSKR